MKLTCNDKQIISDLIEVCKKNQGEYIPGGHGSGSWATTYSRQFISAAAKLYIIFEKSGPGRPIAMLSSHFRQAGIRSCRGNIMNTNKVEYLYKTHLASEIDKYQIVNSLQAKDR